MKNNTVSVKWKLFACLAGFVGVLLLLLWLFQVVFLDAFYRSIRTGDIKKAAATITKAMDSASFSEELEELSHRNNACVVILAADGTELYSVHTAPDCVLHKGNSAEKNLLHYQQAVEGGGTYLDFFSRENFKEPFREDGVEDKGERNPFRQGGMMQSLMYSTLITTPDGQEGVLVLNTVITPLGATVETLRVQLLYISGILLVLALGLALFLSKTISTPIIRINRSAKELATGDYNTHFEGAGYLEIAELANTLNYAAGELSKVEGLRRELIANTSHDLRTPLTMITGYAEVMRDLPGENSSENLQVIIDEAKRLTSLVNDMLDLSKLQAGAQVLLPAPYDLTRSIWEILGRYTKLMEQDGYTITFSPPGPAWVEADGVKMTQVLYNLINNAIAYTGGDKTVRVMEEVADGWVTVSVLDSGEGIDPKELPYIWERYYKVDKTHKRAAIGTGLGLSIVRSVLELHGARYGVESAPGAGSRFWFSLPLAGEDGQDTLGQDEPEQVEV